MDFSGVGPEVDRAAMRAWRRQASAPDNEVPHPVPLAVVLQRTDDVAVAVTDAAAYTTGMRFTLAIRLRVRPPGVGRHGLFQLIQPDPGDDGVGRLLLGVQYGDGRRASTVGGRSRGTRSAPDPDQPVLSPGSGGGGDLTYDLSYWLSPLPPDGPLTFVSAWPALGLPEVRRTVPDSAFASAGARAVVLWPEPPDPADEPPPEPPRPASGWFAAPDDAP